MKDLKCIKPKSLIFAPLEGVTEEPFRLAILKTFPEWDVLYTDFYRVPSVGRISERTILNHIGETIYSTSRFMDKTVFQILASPNSRLEECIAILNDLKIQNLDLNLGCPSNTVNSNFGGAYLLSNQTELKKMLETIRKYFSGIFTVKMRIGYKDDLAFTDNLKLIECAGVDGITLHARTKSQLYQGTADWSYIKKAVETVGIPIIGNGDVWQVDDIDAIYKNTSCHSVMFGRTAMKTPWISLLYKEHLKNSINLDETFLLFERTKFIEVYFDAILDEYTKIGWTDNAILKRFKSLSRYIFDDYDQEGITRGKFLRSESLEEFQNHLLSL